MSGILLSLLLLSIGTIEDHRFYAKDHLFSIAIPKDIHNPKIEEASTAFIYHVGITDDAGHYFRVNFDTLQPDEPHDLTTIYNTLKAYLQLEHPNLQVLSEKEFTNDQFGPYYFALVKIPKGSGILRAFLVNKVDNHVIALSIQPSDKATEEESALKKQLIDARLSLRIGQ